MMSALKQPTKEMASGFLPLILSAVVQGNSSSTSGSSRQQEEQCSRHPSTASTAADISFATEVAVSLSSLYTTHFMCGICLGRMRGTHISPECGHRFCGDCLKKSIRTCNKECPTCRISIPTQRSLREDKMFDNLAQDFRSVMDSVNKKIVKLQQLREFERQQTSTGQDKQTQNSKGNFTNLKKGDSTDPDLDTQIMSSLSRRNCATSIISHRLISEQGQILEKEAEEESPVEILNRAANNSRNKKEKRFRKIISNRELEDSSDEDFEMPNRAANNSRNKKEEKIIRISHRPARVASAQGGIFNSTSSSESEGGDEHYRPFANQRHDARSKLDSKISQGQRLESEVEEESSDEDFAMPNRAANNSRNRKKRTSHRPARAASAQDGIFNLSSSSESDGGGARQNFIKADVLSKLDSDLTLRTRTNRRTQKQTERFGCLVNYDDLDKILASPTNVLTWKFSSEMAKGSEDVEEDSEDVEEENDDNSFEDYSSEFESSSSKSDCSRSHKKQGRMVLQERKKERRKRSKSNESTMVDAEEQSPSDNNSDFDIEAKSEDYRRRRKLRKAPGSDFLRWSGRLSK